MIFVSVIAAGIAAWLVGAAWYMALGDRWMAAAGVTEEETKAAGAGPYIGSLLSALLVAGMARYAFDRMGVQTPTAGALMGLAMGIFMAAPWIANNILFSNRSRELIWMDGGYPALGMAAMGLVLGLF